jgi:hypothetical protein
MVIAYILTAIMHATRRDIPVRQLLVIGFVRVRSPDIPDITERLVHGPLTALMLLETLAYHHPEVQMKSFEYRALNPIIVNHKLTFHGSKSGSNVVLWVQDEAGVVGMKGLVSL